MLVELAIGDAYGVGFENADPSFITANNNLKYVPLDVLPSLIKPGCYSDDTQMTLAIAEAMIDGIDWVPLSLAQKFVDVFKRDERRGYADSFFKFLLDVKDGEDFLNKIKTDSTRSGAAMRSCPIGVVSDDLELVSMSVVQASITHNTPEGVQSALAAAWMTHYFHFDKGPKANLCNWIGQSIPKLHAPFSEWRDDRQVSTRGWDVVRAAATAIQRHDSMTAILKQCIAFGGDTDTVATIAMGAASRSREVKQDLGTTELVDKLENGPFGRDYLADLDKKLGVAS